MFYVIFRILPHGVINIKTAVISSIWCSLLWEILKIGFTIYLVKLSNYAAIYGTYAAIAVLVLWIYYSAVVFVIGAEVGQIYNERKLLKSM
jgi:membrane protein